MDNYFYLIVENEVQPINLPIQTKDKDYRHGNCPIFYPIKMPGLQNVGKVVVENALLPSILAAEWQKRIDQGDRSTAPMSIYWYDEEGGPKMVWLLDDAFPEKINETSRSSNDYVHISKISIVCGAIIGRPI